MSRGSVATLTTAALLAALPSSASALPAGYGTGPGYCSAFGSYASRYSFDGVYACATTASFGATTFDAAGRHSFQCVELSARYLWAVYGIWAGPGSGVQDGANLVAAVHRLDPRIGIGIPGPGNVPVAGDVISLGPGGAVDARYGHTAVVVVASQRTGFVTIISQNFPPGYASRQSLRIGLHGRHNGRVLINGAWTAGSWLELRKPPPPRRLRRARPRHRAAASR